MLTSSKKRQWREPWRNDRASAQKVLGQRTAGRCRPDHPDRSTYPQLVTTIAKFALSRIRQNPESRYLCGQDRCVFYKCWASSRAFHTSPETRYRNTTCVLYLAMELHFERCSKYTLNVVRRFVVSQHRTHAHQFHICKCASSAC